MHKILQVILKDLKNRLSKRWFWVLSLMGPLIFTIMVMVPIGLNTKTASSKVVEVWQEPSGALDIAELPKNEQFNYMIAKGDLDFLISEFLKSNHDVFVVIPKDFKNKDITIYQKNHLSQKLKQQINQDLVNILKLRHLQNIYTVEEIAMLNHTFSYMDIMLNSGGKDATQMVIGLVAAIVIYYFTFSYSVQVMRSVMEEKTNRVVELILVAMKPWQLMLAKILGGSILGLMQFTMWMLLTASILYPLYAHFEMGRFSDQNIHETLLHFKDAEHAWEMNQIVGGIANIEWIQVIPGVLAYFVLGYLLYASMFAAIGASVDQDAETQLFIMPVTAPLAISIVFIQFVAENPDHVWSRFLTIFPLTSPVIAPIKIVTEAMSTSELLLSIAAMVCSITLIVYLSGKIFKAGLLHFGTSATWKEIFKWASR